MHRYLIICIGIISFGGFVWMSLNYDSIFVSWIDDWLIRQIQQPESDYLTSVMKLISYIGSKPIVMFIVSVIIICFIIFKHYWEIGVQL